MDLNQWPPGYEPDELPTALPRDIAEVILPQFVPPVNTQPEKYFDGIVGFTMMCDKR